MQSGWTPLLLALAACNAAGALDGYEGFYAGELDYIVGDAVEPDALCVRLEALDARTLRATPMRAFVYDRAVDNPAPFVEVDGALTATNEAGTDSMTVRAIQGVPALSLFVAGDTAFDGVRVGTLDGAVPTGCELDEDIATPFAGVYDGEYVHNVHEGTPPVAATFAIARASDRTVTCVSLTGGVSDFYCDEPLAMTNLQPGARAAGYESDAGDHHIRLAEVDGAVEVDLFQGDDRRFHGARRPLAEAPDRADATGRAGSPAPSTGMLIPRAEHNETMRLHPRNRDAHTAANGPRRE